MIMKKAKKPEENFQERLAKKKTTKVGLRVRPAMLVALKIVSYKHFIIFGVLIMKLFKIILLTAFDFRSIWITLFVSERLSYK